MKWSNIRKKEKYIIIPIYAVAYIISNALHIGCIWEHFFGVLCPGCGFTRSIISMLRLDFASAWHYHPMFWSIIPLGLYFLFEGDLIPNKRVNAAIFMLICSGFICTWIYRLATGFTF